MPPQGPQPSSMMQNNQGVPSWLPHNGPSPANNFANAQHPPNAVQMPPNTPLQQNAQASHTPGGLHPHNIPMQQPPRSVPTPLSHMNNMQRNGIQSSPGMPAPMASPPNVGQPQSAMPNGMSQLAAQQQQFQQAQRPGQNQLSAQAAQIPALPAEAFKAAYGQWCSKHNIVHDEQLLQIEGKKIDLHRLHQEVIASGTVHRVSISYASSCNVSLTCISSVITLTCGLSLGAAWILSSFLVQALMTPLDRGLASRRSCSMSTGSICRCSTQRSSARCFRRGTGHKLFSKTRSRHKVRHKPSQVARLPLLLCLMSKPTAPMRACSSQVTRDR